MGQNGQFIAGFWPVYRLLACIKRWFYIDMLNYHKVVSCGLSSLNVVMMSKLTNKYCGGRHHLDWVSCGLFLLFLHKMSRKIRRVPLFHLGSNLNTLECLWQIKSSSCYLNIFESISLYYTKYLTMFDDDATVYDYKYIYTWQYMILQGFSWFYMVLHDISWD